MSGGLRVAMIAPEVNPLAKTGGLADVVGALSPALAGLGAEVTVVMPGYRAVAWDAIGAEDTGMRLQVPISNRAEVAAPWRAVLAPGVAVYLLRAGRYFDREGLYGTRAGDHPDNAERFAFFARAALELLRHLEPAAHVLHVHDWQAALVPAFLRADPELYPELAAVRTLISVHNLGYQGLFWHLDWHLLNLDPRYFTPAFLEFYGKINYLKAGLVFSDAITTVSPGYAEEIKTAELGHGLEGVLQERAARLFGILNGADYREWSPEADPHLPARYSACDLSGKARCKAELQREMGLRAGAEVPLAGMVTRLAEQKGVDLLLEALPALMAEGVQLVVLGSGEVRYEEAFAALPARYPGRCAVRVGFDNPLAHRIEGGADLFLMPSRYEPCGLNQIYSLRYGTIPVVRATGGLRDTVEEFCPATGLGTGFRFAPYRPQALVDAVRRALAVYRRPRDRRRLVLNAMGADFSWSRSAREYLALYERLCAEPAQVPPPLAGASP